MFALSVVVILLLVVMPLLLLGAGRLATYSVKKKPGWIGFPVATPTDRNDQA